MKIKTGDNVHVTTGKDRGKSGKVIQTFKEKGLVVVEGVNKLTKHLRKRTDEQPGRAVEFFGPIHASNVALNCPKCGKATRVGKKTLENGKRMRVCKKCNETIE